MSVRKTLAFALAAAAAGLLLAYLSLRVLRNPSPTTRSARVPPAQPGTEGNPDLRRTGSVSSGTRELSLREALDGMRRAIDQGDADSLQAMTRRLAGCLPESLAGLRSALRGARDAALVRQLLEALLLAAETCPADMIPAVVEVAGELRDDRDRKYLVRGIVQKGIWVSRANLRGLVEGCSNDCHLIQWLLRRWPCSEESAECESLGFLQDLAEQRGLPFSLRLVAAEAIVEHGDRSDWLNLLGILGRREHADLHPVALSVLAELYDPDVAMISAVRMLDASLSCHSTSQKMQPFMNRLIEREGGLDYAIDYIGRRASNRAAMRAAVLAVRGTELDEKAKGAMTRALLDVWTRRGDALDPGRRGANEEDRALAVLQLPRVMDSAEFTRLVAEDYRGSTAMMRCSMLSGLMNDVHYHPKGPAEATIVMLLRGEESGVVIDAVLRTYKNVTQGRGGYGALTAFMRERYSVEEQQKDLDEGEREFVRQLLVGR